MAEMSNMSLTEQPRGYTHGLKAIALFFMIIDHMGSRIFPAFLEFRLFGRIAFPLFAWCLVLGAVHTRNIYRYMLRLLVVGLISQPIYNTSIIHSLASLIVPQWLNNPRVDFSLQYVFSSISIFGTLLLALIAIYGIQKKRFLSNIWLPTLSLFAAMILPVDYGWKGVAFVLLLYLARQTRAGVAAVMVAFCLFWGQSSGTVTSLFGLDVNFLSSEFVPLRVLSQYVLRVQFFAILALPFILFPTRLPFNYPKWLAYAAYPVHLLILNVIAFFISRLNS